jgi:hypothetical protein
MMVTFVSQCEKKALNIDSAFRVRPWLNFVQVVQAAWRSVESREWKGSLQHGQIR